MPNPSIVHVPRQRGEMCRFIGKKLAPPKAKQRKLPGVKPETQPLFSDFAYELPDEEAQAKLLRQQRPELFEFTEEDQRRLDEAKK